MRNKLINERQVNLLNVSSNIKTVKVVAPMWLSAAVVESVFPGEYMEGLVIEQSYGSSMAWFKPKSAYSCKIGNNET